MGLLVDQLTCALLSEALPDPHGKVAPPAALPAPAPTIPYLTTFLFVIESFLT